MAIITAIPERTQNRTAMKRVLAYVMQDYKTTYKGVKLVSGQNCIPESAYTEFMATKNQYRKTNGVFFKQYVQSFKPGTATPELIHQIGVETAKFFDGFEVVIATHIDKDHWHNHFVVNSVNCETGLKIQINEKGLEDLRNYSDKICRQFGLEILKPYTKPKQTTINTKEYRAAMKGESWKFALMATIDQAMKYCKDKDEFKNYLKRYGYDVKWQENYKYITYTCPNNMKCRDIRLHQDKYKKEMMELEFRLRELEMEKRRASYQNGRSNISNDSGQGLLAGVDTITDKSADAAGEYNRQRSDGKTDNLFNPSGGNEIEVSDRSNCEQDIKPAATGWETEREHLFSGKRDEQQYRTFSEIDDEEMAAVDNSASVGNTDPFVSGLYALASAAEMNRQPKAKTPKPVRNKKRRIGQREDDHSGDYQNNNKLYYGQSM